MRRGKGPVSYMQWTEALASPLTYENAQYMQRGVCKSKDLYPALFNRLSDYVTDEFDNAAKRLNAESVGTDVACALHRFAARFGRLFFFRRVGSLEKKDADRLASSLCEAAQRVLARYEKATDADILFECAAIRRIATTEAKRAK